MGRGKRWAYMAHPNHNPPNNDCPECEEPSKTYHLGAKTVEGVKVTSYMCEHRHRWTIEEPRPR